MKLVLITLRDPLLFTFSYPIPYEEVVTHCLRSLGLEHSPILSFSWRLTHDLLAGGNKMPVVLQITPSGGGGGASFRDMMWWKWVYDAES